MLNLNRVCFVFQTTDWMKIGNPNGIFQPSGRVNKRNGVRVACVTASERVSFLVLLRLRFIARAACALGM